MYKLHYFEHINNDQISLSSQFNQQSTLLTTKFSDQEKAVLFGLFSRIMMKSLRRENRVTVIMCGFSSLRLFVAVISITIVDMNSQFVNSLQMVNLDLPENAMVGETIDLNCLYSLDETLFVAKGPSSLISNEFIRKNGNIMKLEENGLQINAQEDAKFKSNSSPSSSRIDNEPLKQWPQQQQQDAYNSQIDILYAVKWYKDDREFYRYLARDFPKKLALPVDGIQVDVSILFVCGFLCLF